MRISKEKAQENRERVLATAAALFRAKGMDAVAVGDLMREAGFTHGGFYNHFASKDALAQEAMRRAFDEIAAERARADDLETLLEGYLSWAARRSPGRACPVAAFASDVGRQGEAMKAAFAGGLEEMIADLAAGLPDTPDRRTRAVALAAQMVGALLLSRAVPDTHPLADEVLLASRRVARDQIK